MTQNETERIVKVRNKLFELYYSSLNPQQQKALSKVNGPLLVLAGAGSGKTTVLVKRIAHIISFGDAWRSKKLPELNPQEIELIEALSSNAKPEDKMLMKGILSQFAVDPCPPDRVLAITFTNKAAGEIKSRLETELGDKASQIWAGTFHSICVRILRRHIDLLDYERDFVIYDTDDQKKLVKDCVKKLSLDDEVFTPKKVLRHISNCKNELKGWEDLLNRAGGDYEKEKIAEIFKEYQRALREASALDFDDIISMTVDLFRRFPDVLDIYKNKFRYVLVDEYQDTNRAQCLLMTLIGSGHENVMVVGDDDQSIYRFRGAVIDNILSFDRTYPDAEVIRLEQNYRSTSTILDAANAVICNNSRRKGKKLWCGAGKGEKIVVHRSEDQEAEASYIADTVNSLVASGKAKYKDFAVLYRVNAVSNALETVLTKSGVPHRLLGGLRFTDRAEIRDMIAYLCVVNNPHDSVHLKRIINVPRRGIGETTADRVLALSESTGKDPIEIMASASDYAELKKSAGTLLKFAGMINSLREKAQDESVKLSALFRMVIDASGYIEMLDKAGDDGEDKKENIEELISSAISFEKNNPGGRLCDFL
ncbi:MAG: UvrD-helicase domain-containing protein [Clostridia bacterium]|nr:UvrD-helicase domain-containing protein [Clostridia bacterium]